MRHRAYFGAEARNKRSLIMVCLGLAAILLILIAILFIVGDNQKDSNKESTPQTSNVETATGHMDELELLSVETVDSSVVITTNYGTMRYSAAFVDIMQVEVENLDACAQLVFSVLIDGAWHKIYALMINVKDELLVGHWTIGDTVYPVSAILYAPEGIRDDELLTFYAAQETFNDIMFSLEENKGFAST